MAPGGSGGRRAQVSPAATALTSADYLRYFYYAGMVFIGLKRYGDAIDMFQVGGQRAQGPATRHADGMNGDVVGARCWGGDGLLDEGSACGGRSPGGCVVAALDGGAQSMMDDR